MSKHTKEYKKEQRKQRTDRIRCSFKWFWTDFDRWICYQYAKRKMIKNQAFLLVKESTDEEIEKMYKNR